MKRNITLSIDAELLAQAERLAGPGEGRTALFERLLAHGIRHVEDTELDEIYDRAMAKHPPTDAAAAALSAKSRAAYTSTHGARG
jgi:hypothetical protein